MWMKNLKKLLTKSKTKADKTTRNRRTWVALAIALYLTFLLFSAIAFTADRTVESQMKDSYEYHLVYRREI